MPIYFLQNGHDHETMLGNYFLTSRPNENNRTQQENAAKL